MCTNKQIIDVMASVCVPIWGSCLTSMRSDFNFQVLDSFGDTLSIPLPDKIVSQRGMDPSKVPVAKMVLDTNQH